MTPGARKKGFTLVEVLVVTGLISLVIGLTATLVLSSMNVFARSARLDHGKQLGLAVYDYYENRLKTATDVQIGGTPRPEYRRLAVMDGRVLTENGPLYGEDMYGGMEVTVTTKVADGPALCLTVTVRDSRGDIFVKESALRLINLAAAGAQVAGQTAEGRDLTLYYKD